MNPRISTLDKISHALLEIYEAGRNASLDAFQQVALEQLQSCLRFTSSWWGEATMTPAGLDIHQSHTYNQPPELVKEYLAVRDEDVVAAGAFDMTKPGLVTIRVHAPTAFTSKSFAGLRSYAKKLGHQSDLITYRADRENEFLEWVSLYRSNPDDHWRDSEYHLGKILVPHLFEAVRINRDVGQARLYRASRELAFEYAIADRRGFVLHGDATFFNILEEEFSNPVRRRLPKDMMDRLLAEGLFRGRTIAVLAKNSAGLLFLRARRLVPADLLTDRERTVANLLMEGHTHKSVARRLTLSPDTVKTHIKAIYEKTSVHNRAGLIAVMQCVR